MEYMTCTCTVSHGRNKQIDNLGTVCCAPLSQSHTYIQCNISWAFSSPKLLWNSHTLNHLVQYTIYKIYIFLSFMCPNCLLAQTKTRLGLASLLYQTVVVKRDLSRTSGRIQLVGDPRVDPELAGGL